MGSPPAGALVPGTSYQLLAFSDLEGWSDEDHGAALEVFRETCPDLKEPDWRALCALAGHQTNPRLFFELFFRPVQIDDGAPARFTGYFEPELRGSRNRSDRFQYPLYSYPPDADEKPWLTRREIVESESLADDGLAIAWVEDPVELYFLQIQGSGRIHLEDGSWIRVGYAGANGHPNRSIGLELARRGLFEEHEVSAEVIRTWVRDNPDEGRELLFHNPSYVFFREISDVPADEGPLGAMNRPITELRTIAVDPTHVPLGAPTWIEKDGAEPMRRLMVAQDTGGAIKGAQRADIFFGTGDAAGRAAGRLNDPGRLVVLLPIQRAYALLPEGAS